MFKMFKRNANKKVLVWKQENGCEDVYEVATFSQKEEAKEYCEKMNKEDNDFYYFYF